MKTRLHSRDGEMLESNLQTKLVSVYPRKRYSLNHYDDQYVFFTFVFHLNNENTLTIIKCIWWYFIFYLWQYIQSLSWQLQSEPLQAFHWYPLFPWGIACPFHNLFLQESLPHGALAIGAQSRGEKLRSRNYGQHHKSYSPFQTEYY